MRVENLTDENKNLPRLTEQLFPFLEVFYASGLRKMFGHALKHVVDVGGSVENLNTRRTLRMRITATTISSIDGY